MTPRALLLLLLACLCVLPLAHAQEEEPLFLDEEDEEDVDEPLLLDEEEEEEVEDPEDTAPLVTDEVEVITSPVKKVAEQPGSVQRLNEEDFETFEYDDPHAYLTTITGLYVRQEDGFGLRPNIGLRGTSSERSSKVTLMEDEVLLAPAPYSAPAAYYFPIMTRMTGLDVYKGPGAIAFGPNTIGGAVNLITRDIPIGWAAGVDVSSGMFLNSKAHAFGGASNDWGGFLVEGVYLHSNGFKELDGGGDTGFDKGEIMVKGRITSDPLDDGPFHQLDLKLGLALERSHETYLGLSDDDFASNPYRRYRGSSQDLMEWFRTQVELRYVLETEDDVFLQIAAYRNDFSRAWRKLNAFDTSLPLPEILSDPTSARRRVFYDVLTGAQDSADPSENLLIGTNDRTFVSQGLQTSLTWLVGGNRLEAGFRLHYDSIERNHTEQPFAMRDGDLESAGDDDATTRNIGETFAAAAHVQMDLDLSGLQVTPGVRLEYITSSLENLLTETRVPHTYTVLVPGIGVLYDMLQSYKDMPFFAIFAGVHQGFSPVSPGQPEDARPESSVNYELGLRVDCEKRKMYAELIGFFSDYQNLTSICSFSGGCPERLVDTQLNAGEVFVYGLEVLVDKTFDVGPVELPLRLAYTFSGSHFRTDFTSSNPQLSEVVEGDALPYVPEHQLSLQVGAVWNELSGHIATTWTSPMRETASQGDEGPMTDHIVMLDLALSYAFYEGFQVYGRLDNMLNTTPIVSRRPYGARPGKPFSAILGLKYRYE